MLPRSLPALRFVVALGAATALAACQGKDAPAPPPAASAPAAAKAAAPAAAAATKTPADLPSTYVRADKLAGLSFEGLTPEQSYHALRALNELDCHCKPGTLAQCWDGGDACAAEKEQSERAVRLAREGQDADAIKRALALGDGKPVAEAPSGPIYKVPLGRAPTRGLETAKVTMVIFSDFQCPFCSRVLDTLKQLEQQYGADLRVAFHQNPLSFHADAPLAAEAALAAHEQGKFWEMHDRLFQGQSALGREALDAHAVALGLDLAKFKTALDNRTFKKWVDEDIELARKLGANGTPAFFINGEQLMGAQPVAEFQKVIDRQKARAEAALAAGAAPSRIYDVMIKDGLAEAPSPENEAPAVVDAADPSVPDDAPSRGPKDAKVTIVAFSDFQCPFCSRGVAPLAEATEKYPKDVRVVFRNLPLDFHPNAMPAAEAALAAHAQGKFWEMHDKLFQNQTKLSGEDLHRYAAELGLDAKRFADDLGSGKWRARVRADLDEAQRIGADGTPMFYVNGRLIAGAQPFPAFRALIEAERAAADELLAKGVKPAELYAKRVAANVAAAKAARPAAAEGEEAGDPGDGSGPPKAVELGNAPAKGPKDAPITIIAFSDFECPFCSRVLPTFEQIEKEYAGKVRVAFKNSPLPFHPNARLAAEAALAAGEQGKFWEMHDKLFANQRALTRPDLERYAGELGLEVVRFKQALDSDKFAAQVEADLAQAEQLGVDGTPSFFINGRNVVGARPFEAFKRVIDDELKKAGAAGR